MNVTLTIDELKFITEVYIKFRKYKDLTLEVTPNYKDIVETLDKKLGINPEEGSQCSVINITT